MKTIPVTCNKDCGGGCPLLAHVEHGKIVRIKDNPAGTPYMTGCIRGFKGYLSLYASDRITQPLIRTGPRGSGSFRSVSWDEAVKRAVENLEKYRNGGPGNSLLRLGGSGACESALHNTNRLTRRFLNLFGNSTDRTGSYSAGAELFTLPFVFGNEPYGLDPRTLFQSRLIILWGMNPADTIFGCELRGCLREIKKQGIPIWVIDPRRTNTVKQFATRWIPILPGTDSVMMSAVLYEMLHSGDQCCIDRDFLNTYTTGFEEIEAYVTGREDGIPKTAAWAEKMCGVPTNVIKEFTRVYGAARPAALLPGLSVQRTIGGEEAVRMAVVLQAATGNIGIKGGSSGGNPWGRLPAPLCGKIPQADGTDTCTAVPEYLWADAVLEGRGGGYPTDIKALYSVGGNFLNQGSDIKKNIEAFEKVECVISHEIFMTPTARWSDIIFPATLPLERDDIIHPAGNYLLYSHTASSPPAGVKDDFEIFRLLAQQLGFEKEFTEGRTPGQWLDYCISVSQIEDVEGFKQSGIYLAEEQERVGLSRFIEAPETHHLATPSGKIELASKAYGTTGFPSVPKSRCMEVSPQFPLRLITPHARLRINSQNYNIPWFREHEDHSLSVHPEDARARSIRDGDKIEIISEKGRIEAIAGVTEGIMPGVVSLSQGVWLEQNNNPAVPHGSVNLLTSTEPTKPSNSSRTHSVRVEVHLLRVKQETMGSGRDGTVKDNTIVLKTGKTVSYRLLQRGDEKALQRFHEHLSKRSQELFTPHAYTNDVLQKIIQRTEEGTDRAYTLWDGIRCIAYFYLWWFNTDYPVLGIGIIDEFQGMGLGRRLINIMLEDAVRAGRAGVELTTELENARAKALYEAMGFKTLGVVENQNGDGRTIQEYHMFYPIKPGATPPERSFGPPV